MPTALITTFKRCCCQHWRQVVALVALLAVSLLAPIPAFAADSTPSTAPLRDYSIDRWTTVEGLPHNSIRGIAQTPEGHLWLATWEGLVSYNGLEFTVYNRGNTPGMLDNGIGSFYADSKGRLWIGDSRGNLGRRDPDGELHFIPRTADWPNVLIEEMTMDGNGTLWILYEGKGLASLDRDGNFRREPAAAGSILEKANTRMVVDVNKRLWMGSFGGLMFRDIDGDGVTHPLPKSDGLPSGLAWPYLAPDGQLWVAAGDSIYRMVDGRPQLHFKLPDNARLISMLMDGSGQLWLGTENLGLFRLTDQYGLEHLSSTMNLPGGRITEIMEDAEGSIWVGANGGLFRLRETLFSNFTMRDGLSGSYVRSVMQDARGRFWVGSAEGLDWIDEKGVIHKLVLPTKSGNAPSVLSLAQDKRGNIWVGTYVDGVFRIGADNKIRRFGVENGLPVGNIRAVAVDDDGVAWFGTQSGVARLVGDRATMLQGKNAPAIVTVALSSQPGELWIGTIAGARVLRGDSIENIDLSAGSGARSVFGFRRLGDDMWLVTDRGLYRYRNGELAHVGLEQGMPVDATFEMVPDRQGNVWITSNRGVMRTTHEALDAVADGRSERISVQRYTEMDGMVSSQTNGSSGPSAWLGRDGDLWVATSSGVSMVDPTRLAIVDKVMAPPTVIESLRLEGEPLLLGEASQGISLPGGERVSVGYVGLSFVLPERIVYRTRLDGLDNDWIDRGRQRNVEFIGLAPGDYSLRVAAAHPGGEWGSKVATWDFRIEPFWWQRSSVRIAALLALLALMVGGYFVVLNRYRAANLRLSRLVDERTDDLRLQADRLLLADQEKSTLLNQIREQSEAFQKQAREDSLTGLPNRRAFDEALARALQWAKRDRRPLSLAMIDVDHFKRVNDQHSHSIGDAVLREVGRLLSGSIRVSDVPARVGGEEFALLFHDATLEQAQATCEKLQQRFHEQRNWAGVRGLQISFSAGVVQWSGEGEIADTLLQRADTALYQAKETGRDRICTG